MKSKVQLGSHPLHPILINFPIAFFTGTLLFDALALATGNPDFATTGRYLNIAGIIGAVLAALPGFLDFLYTVPPKSSASKRAAKHGILNVIALLIFIAILWYRSSAQPNTMLIVGLDAAGVTIMMIAAWMGGTLVHRNQIGIDIRYAGAGKWKEEYISSKDTVVQVADAAELKPNQMKLIHLNGKRIVLGRTEDNYVAFDDFCTHRGGSLAGGVMICGTVQCPWHGSQFDVRTGEVKAGPAKERIRTYVIQERDGKVFLTQ